MPINEETKKKIKDLNNYKYGFSTDIDVDEFPKGLSEEVIKLISEEKKEPKWLLDFRLKAFKHLQRLEVPNWSEMKIPNIDFDNQYFFAKPKNFTKPNSLDEVDPKILETYNKLNIPIKEQEILAGVKKGVAVDAVFDSVSVYTSFKDELKKAGVLFLSFSEAVLEYEELVKKFFASVVPYTDNYFACLNSCVFSDGTFVYVPKDTRCPMELSTYFRMNASNTGQFERTLIIAEENSYVSYLEGCTAPMREDYQLHAAIVEIIVHKDAEVKYSTVQNWYPGDENGKGGIFNFVTKRAHCREENAKVSWTQVETGSAITWKYPSCILTGDNSVGEFYSIAISNNYQQADTGTKMLHIGKNTKSKIISKGISAGNSRQAYRGEVKIAPGSDYCRNFTQCDSLIIGPNCSAITIPYIVNNNNNSIIEHEATTSKLSEDKLNYLQQRGFDEEAAVSLLVTGFCKEVLQKLPMEFAVEAKALLEISLEGAVG